MTKHPGSQVVCFRCGLAGGTLVKVGSRGYAHENCQRDRQVGLVVKDEKLMYRRIK